MDEILAIGFKFAEWINFYWNFYVVFVLAIAGWLFSKEIRFTTTQKIVISYFLISFIVVSLLALGKTYESADSIVQIGKEEIKKTEPANRTPKEKAQFLAFERLDYSGWGWMLAAHITTDVVILTLIWVDPKMRTRQDI